MRHKLARFKLLSSILCFCLAVYLSLPLLLLYNPSADSARGKYQISGIGRIQAFIVTPEDLELIEVFKNDSPDCIYPSVTTDHDSLDSYFQQTEYLICKENKTNPNLFELSLNGILGSRDKELGVNVLDVYSCNYKQLGGVLAPDYTTLKYGPARNITSNTTRITMTMFVVSCDLIDSVNSTWRFTTNSTTNLAPFYEREFAQILEENIIQNVAESEEDRLSIDIIEIDSVSINMFKRHMPDMYKYFKSQSNWFVFEKPNKVMDNTLDKIMVAISGNMVAIMTGKKFMERPYDKSDKVINELKYNRKRKVDFNDRTTMGFIWDRFKDLNCTTLLNLDPGKKSLGWGFYPNKYIVGFSKAPADIFLRPFYFHLLKDFPGIFYRPDPLCRHEVPDHEVILKIIKQWQTATKDQCHFSWTQALNNYAHDEPNLVTHLQDPFLKFFKSPATERNLNKTVLLFMGDHGNRISAFRSHPIGQIEMEQAFFALRFPTWYEQKYPETIRNLRENTKNIVTHYDIHETLLDIIGPKVPREPLNSKRAQSLFKKMPNPTRSCQEMDVPDHYCLCMLPYNAQNNGSPTPPLVYEQLAMSIAQSLKCQSSMVVTILEATSWAPNLWVRNNVKHFDKKKRKEYDKKKEVRMYFYRVLGRVGPKLYFRAQVQVSKLKFLNDFQLTCLNYMNRTVLEDANHRLDLRCDNLNYDQMNLNLCS